MKQNSTARFSILPITHPILRAPAMAILLGIACVVGSHATTDVYISDNPAPSAWSGDGTSSSTPFLAGVSAYNNSGTYAGTNGFALDQLLYTSFSHYSTPLIIHFLHGSASTNFIPTLGGSDISRTTTTDNEVDSYWTLQTDGLDQSVVITLLKVQYWSSTANNNQYAVFQTGLGGSAHDITIQNLTIDCNYAGLTNAYSSTSFLTDAVELHGGNNFYLYNITVKDAGNYVGQTQINEAFPLSIGISPSGTTGATGWNIESCTVDWRGGYTSAITLSGDPTASSTYGFTNGIINNCAVECPSFGSYPGIYSGKQMVAYDIINGDAPTIKNSTSYYGTFGAYTDSGVSRNIMVNGNIFHNTLDTIALQPNHGASGITITNNTIYLPSFNIGSGSAIYGIYISNGDGCTGPSIEHNTFELGDNLDSGAHVKSFLSFDCPSSYPQIAVTVSSNKFDVDKTNTLNYFVNPGAIKYTTGWTGNTYWDGTTTLPFPDPSSPPTNCCVYECGTTNCN